MIQSLLDAGLLRLVCVDEAHLFAKFGLYFRSEFYRLKTVLFRQLLVPPQAWLSYTSPIPRD